MAPQIPSQQWAQVCSKPGGPLEYKQVPVTSPASDEVLVNIKYSGVCHTDLHAMKGDWPLQLKMPLIGGHEGAGVVVAKGELVSEVNIGDHVGVKWLNGSCLSCDFCEQADEPLCAKALLSGYTVDGTFQQYCIAKAAHVSPIPKHASLEEVAPVLCAGITVYKGLKEANVKPGNVVAIVGAGGGLGALAQQYAKAMGLRVIAIDAGDEKKALCEKMGAEAAAYVRPRGTIVAIGMPKNAYLKAPVFQTVTKMISIKGSYVGNRRDSKEAIDFFSRGLIKVPIKTVPLEELPKVFDLMEHEKVAGRYVLKMPE